MSTSTPVGVTKLTVALPDTLRPALEEIARVERKPLSTVITECAAAGVEVKQADPVYGAAALAWAAAKEAEVEALRSRFAEPVGTVVDVGPVAVAVDAAFASEGEL